MYRTSHNFGVQNGFYIYKDGEFFESQLLKMIERKARERGANFHYRTAVEQLIRDSATGRVTGVIARRPDGSYVKFVAKKAVVLCTGDYGGNKEMVNAWCSFANHADFCMYVPVGQNTGDGHKMGLWAGAALQKAPHFAMMHPVTGGPLAHLPFLYVNKLGERYGNEDMPFTEICNARIMQPGNVAWTIYDSNYRTYAANMPANGGLATPLIYPGLEADIAKAIAAKMGYTGNSIEELAQAMNIPSQKFSNTVKRYNELVAKGVDDDFGKRSSNLTPIQKAPFYAMNCSAPLVVTLGGLNVSPQMEVLDGKDDPIPGLYAIGNVAGNFFGNDYTSICLGISHGRCLTFGRLLGQALSEGRLIEM
jgi:fumarate reductase flavoprotein subunit